MAALRSTQTMDRKHPKTGHKCWQVPKTFITKTIMKHVRTCMNYTDFYCDRRKHVFMTNPFVEIVFDDVNRSSNFYFNYTYPSTMWYTQKITRDIRARWPCIEIQDLDINKRNIFRNFAYSILLVFAYAIRPNAICIGDYF